MSTTTGWRTRAVSALSALVLLTSGMFTLAGADVAVAAVGPGEIWTVRNPAEANFWQSVTYGNGTFVAVAQNGTHRVMTSPNGLAWTAQTAAEANNWTSVTHGNDTFVAIAQSGTHQAMTSPDGVTWTAQTAAEANSWTSVTYGNDTFVAVAGNGSHRVMTSPDGVTWTAQTAAEANNWRSVTYGNDTFVAVAESGTHRVMTSPDGITWTTQTAAEANSWWSATYGSGTFVATALDGTHRAMTSLDGISWTAQTAAEAKPWRYVAYGNGTFVGVAGVAGPGETHCVMTSPDGATWTARDTQCPSSGSSVVYGNGIFVATFFVSVLTSGVASAHFDPNSGTGTMADQIATTSTALTTNTFTRAGYTFTGWNVAANGSGTTYANSASFPFTADTTLYAQWTPVTYTVHFDANGGTGSMTDQLATAPTALTANSFTRAGYTFTGWNTAANGSGSAYTDGASYPFTTDTTLYAQWAAVSYTVHFNPNGGTGSMTDQVAWTATALTANTFARVGYTFAGWNTAANGSGSAYTDGASYSFTTDTTLYAQWALLYIVHFNANGGTGTIANQTASTPTALTPNSFTRSGFTFAGWNTSPDGLGLPFADGAIYPFDADTTMYAQWSAVPHTVHFDANGGTGSMTDQTTNTPTALTANTFTRAGYTLAGWNTATNGTGTTYADGASYDFLADLTLYAQWTPISYTVHFDANGGTGSMTDQTTNTPTALTANTFTRAGYTFAGWNTAADGSGTAYADTAIYDFTVDVTLYAQWTPISYTVHFDANGGTGSMSDQLATAPTALTANSFTRAGYTFTGWNTAADGSGTTHTDTSTYQFDADVTLYAQWTALPRTVHFEANGGTGTMTDQTTNTPTALTANTFTHAAYTFAGWNTATNGTGLSYADNGTYPFDADVTLYAQWTSAVWGQSIEFAAIADRTLAQSPFTVSAIASSRLTPVTFTSQTPTVCTTTNTNGTKITLLTAGTCTLQATQLGNATYQPTTRTRSFTITKATQSIEFAAIADRTLAQSPFTVSAIASSRLTPVTFTSQTPTVCTTTNTNGTKITLLTAGTCTLQATQLGNATYQPTTRTRSFTITKATQSIEFAAIADRTLAQSPFTVSAIASSRLTPVTFTSQTPTVCTTTNTNGTKITLLTAGTCTLQATQLGNATYQPTTRTRSFTITKATQSIEFAAIADRTLAQSPFTVSAIASSRLTPVTFTSQTPTVCTTTNTNGTKITLLTAGTCTLQATQLGNATYQPTTRTRSFTVR